MDSDARLSRKDQGYTLSKKSFSLVEVIMAASIVAIAVVSCYEVIFMVRALNVRAEFYGATLPFVRQKMTQIVSSHSIPVPTGTGIVPGLATANYTISRKSMSATVDKVILKIESNNKSLQKLTFETYVTNRVKR